MVAPAGAGPWPQITSGRPLRTSNMIAGTSPPGPLRCGSTTWSVNAVAQAASKALPPFSNVDMPTAVAIQWVEVTTPNVPSISGRVVKGLGLMLLIRVQSGFVPPRAASVYHDLDHQRRHARYDACNAAWRGNSIGDPLAVIDRARACRHLKMSESALLPSFRHDFAHLAGRCSGKGILGMGGVRYDKTCGNFSWRRQRRGWKDDGV